MRSPHAATREQPRQPQPGKAQAQQPRHSQSNQIKTRIKQGRILNILPVGINQLESRTADDAMSTFGKDSENIYTHTHSREKTLSNRETQNQILKAMSIESVMPSNHLIVCRPLCPQSFPASGSFPVSQLFTSVGHRIGVSSSASTLPRKIHNWFPFRMDWLDLLAVQRTLRSLLQHHSSKASVLQHSTFFMVQLSHHT